MPPRPTDPVDPAPEDLGIPNSPDSHSRSDRYRILVDVGVLLAVITAVVVLVVIAHAGPEILAAASGFTLVIFGGWLKGRH